MRHMATAGDDSFLSGCAPRPITTVTCSLPYPLSPISTTLPPLCFLHQINSTCYFAMERKDMKRGKKPSSSSSGDSYSGDKREDGRITSASELFERMNQGVAQGRHDAQKELTGSEFLEFLKRQGPEGSRSGRGGSTSRNQNTQRYKNQNDQTVAIDQCDITSSVDYGSRDYYYPSAHTSDAPYIHKENERDDLYKTSTDTRGNWWEGSFYY